MSEEKKCFVFYESWYKQIRMLPEQDQLQLYDAICKYAFSGETADFNVYLNAIMSNIKDTIDATHKRQEAYREQRKKAIQSRWNKVKNNDTSEYDRIQPNTSEYNNKYKDKSKDKSKDKDKDKQSIIEHSSTSTQNVDAGAEGNLKIEIVPSDKEKEQIAFYKSVADYFNKAMEGKRIQRIKMLNNFRKSHIEARMKEYGNDAIIEVIKKASESDFLNGCGGKGFVATFDWLIRPNNFVKVLEGNYDNHTNQTTNNYGTNNWQQDDVGTGCNNIADRRRRDAAWAEYAKRRLRSNEQSEEIPAALQDF